MKDQLKFVQILRGFAAIAVVLFHLDTQTLTYFNHSLLHFKYGYLAIDFFFALTGFIIIYVHLKDIEHKNSVKKFLLKRAVRIYPFYWLILLIVIGLDSPEFHNKPTLRSAISPTTLEGWITIIKNIFLYPLPDTHMPVGIAWSLSYAIVFYIVFAVCIRQGWKITRYIFIAWLLLVLINSLNIFPKTILTEVLAGNLIIEFLIGCAAGYLFAKNKWQINSVQMMFSFVAIAVLFAAYVLWEGLNRSDIIITTLVGTASALIIFSAASLDREKKYKNYASPFLVLIGDASYSIFLTHIIFIPYLCQGLNKVLNVAVVPDFFKNILIILVLFLTILAGIVTFLVIERPLLNYLRRKFRLKQKRKSWI